MTLLAAITAALEGFSATAKAFPLWLAWKLTKDCEQLTERIIQYEKAGNPADRSAADRLRSSLTYRRKLHAALLAGYARNLGGNDDPDETRSLSRPS